MNAHIQVKQHGIKQCDLHDGLRSADPQRRNAATPQRRNRNLGDRKGRPYRGLDP